MSRPVLIQVRPQGSGQVVEHRFTTSPIRIGRNTLNELCLPHAFVSNWHAIIHFDDQGVRYFDLGSTNGSLQDGAVISPGQEVRFEGSTRIEIGELELTSSRPSTVHELARPRRGSSSAGVIATSSGSRGSQPQPDALAELALGLGVPAPSSTEERKDFVLTVQRALQTLAHTVLRVEAAMSRFEAELGLESAERDAPMDPIGARADPLARLLGARSDGRVSGEPGDRVAALFSDFVDHQLALLGGMLEGAHALLAHLDPDDIEFHAAGRFGRRTTAKWALFVERHRELAHDSDRLSTLFFGPEFARAYQRIARTSAPPDTVGSSEHEQRSGS